MRLYFTSKKSQWPNLEKQQQDPLKTKAEQKDQADQTDDAKHQKFQLLLKAHKSELVCGHPL